jgi:hypothetical protein
MTKRTGWIVAAVVVMAAAGLVGADEPGAEKGGGKGGGGRKVAEIAAGMPEIKRDGNVVRLPLTNEGALAWRGIREGVKVEKVSVAWSEAAEQKSEAKEEAIKVSYKRTRGQAAGAALVIKPGTLTGLERMELTMTGTRTQRLSVSLQDQAGVVWTFPAVALREGERTEQTLKAADIAPDAYQNKGKVEAQFDPASVVMITVLDIGGYMSVTEPDCAWTIEGMKGVCK